METLSALTLGVALFLPTPGTAAEAWSAAPVDPARLLAEDDARRAAGDPATRVGLPMKTHLTTSNSGVWEELPNADRIWRLQVQTRGALWTVLGFDEFRVPPGAELRVLDPQRQLVRGPFTDEDERDHGKLWVAPVEGDTLILELYWPARHSGLQPQLSLGTVSHGYRPWGGIGTSQTVGAGSCHQDINCPPGEDFQLQKRGVVLLLIGGGGSCTGSLINNTSLDCAPYVLTAKHCLDGEDLASVMFRFHFEQPACGEPGIPATQIKTGAIARASAVSSDFQLIELSEAPDADWNVFFNGWSRSTQAATESSTIHHPMSDLKKITHDADPLVNGIDQGPDHWRVNQWEEGSTDEGSSGAPLFDQNRRIVGQLNVDTAACDNPAGFAEFGKLDVSWNLGLGPFLDPPGCVAALCGVSELDGMDESLCGSPAPRLSQAGHVVDDSGESNDGAAEPGEVFGLEVSLHNDGPLDATAVSGTLSASDPLVTVVDDAATWSDVPPYETQSSNAPHFTVALDLNFVCGDSIPLQLSVSSAEGNWQSDFLLPTGTVVGLEQPPPFQDDMESGTNGWTESTLIGTNPWSLISGESNSPTHSWHVPDVVGVRDSVLIMPTVASMPPRAALSFAHRMMSELGDGGVLEYSTDGATWVDAGPLITLGPYNSIIPTGFSSPIAGRLAWAGDLGGWRTVDVDLSSLEGQQVTLRWRFATDTFSGNLGWYVDDVVLNSPGVFCLPCLDEDNDGLCPAPDGNDCDDQVPSCTTDCSTDVDTDSVADCADTCLDRDQDGYGDPGGAGDTCTATDCDDDLSACNVDCTDDDGDTVPNCAPDNCIDTSNPNQEDFDGDGIGDVCETGATLSDINHSTRVDGFDLAALGQALGSQAGDGNYAAAADLNRDDQVDGMDLDLLSQFFGQDVE